MADLAGKLLKQIEYYFSDANFSRDKFLRPLAAQDEQGYIPISTFLTFNRVKELTSDAAQLLEAIKKSTNLQINAENTHVKRTTPLPTDYNGLDQSIYTKGWKEGATIESIEEAFSKFGKIASVKIRKNKDKSPKNSAFIEFSKTEEANNACATSPIKIGDMDIITMKKGAYVDMKKEEVQKRKEGKRKSTDDAEEGDKKESKRAKTEEPKEEKTHARGVLIKYKEIGPDVDRETLKAVFGEFGKVAFVDHSKGNVEGVVRMDTPEEAKKAVETLTSSKKEIGGKVPTLSILEATDEDEYWAKTKESRGGKGGRGGRGGARGGRGGRGGKRRRF